MAHTHWLNVQAKPLRPTIRITAPSNFPFRDSPSQLHGDWTTPLKSKNPSEPLNGLVIITITIKPQYTQILCLSLSETNEKEKTHGKLEQRAMVRKCREIAVMDVAPVGVKTRARAPLAMATANSATKTKKRKLNAARELKLSSPTSSSSCVQLRTRRGLTITQETMEERRCSSPSSDHDATTSCCSSNGSSSLLSEEEKRSEFVDLQVKIEFCDKINLFKNFRFI